MSGWGWDQESPGTEPTPPEPQVPEPEPPDVPDTEWVPNSEPPGDGGTRGDRVPDDIEPPGDD